MGKAGALSSQTQRDLEGITLNLSKKLKRRVVRGEAAVREKREKEEQANRDFLVRFKRREARVNRYLARARKGLSMLVAFGESEMLQRFLAAQSSLSNSDEMFTFYHASRPSGEAWDLSERDALKQDTMGRIADGTRDVIISLCHDRVSVVFGAWRVGETRTFDFPYDSTTFSSRDRLLEMEDVYSMLRDNVREIDPFYAMSHKQRDYEWEPSEIAGKVLMDCADPKKFERYMVIALKRERAKNCHR